jgi:NAD+ synthase (glutamine-hydrolysing)
LRIALAQLNAVVGDLDGNRDRIHRDLERARTAQADLVVFPELAATGYPPEDLLLRPGFVRAARESVERIAAATDGIVALVGTPWFDRDLANACAVCADGRVQAVYGKQFLPNYGVFDEHRYFAEGRDLVVLRLGEVLVGITICEDVWQPGPPATDLALAGAQLIVNLSASPFHVGKAEDREEMLVTRARDTSSYFAFCNLVGGQDELVFDGGSFALHRDGSTAFEAPLFEEEVFVIDVDAAKDGPAIRQLPLPREPDPIATIYSALVTGIRDYVDKNGFPGVILGLSGGIDSALTLAVAVDALGAGRVMSVMMPSRFTSQMSREDAKAQARTMGVRFETLSIEPIFEAVTGTLAPVFAGLSADSTEENIQARCRGILLMALSNKLGHMLLTTGNKSEMAVGYATLYGDMAGGFAPLKDCTKQLVYALARYRNGRGRVIPERVITREPTAELAPDQKDSDSLPPYAILDAILEAFIEHDQSVDEISASGFDRATVVRVLQMVKRAEYKRRQAPPGVRISSRAFGRDWRYPITSGY